MTTQTGRYELDRIQTTNDIDLDTIDYGHYFDIDEVESSEELSNPIQLFNKLKKVDWDFQNVNTSFLTHDLHPYPAKFIPQIPYHLIANMSLRGEIILDPFGGSGTTAFEALRLGRRAISLDANPVSQTIGRAKTTYLTSDEIDSLNFLTNIVQDNYLSIINSRTTHEELLEDYKGYIPEIPNIEKWFKKIAVSELALLRHLIEMFTENNAKNVALTSFIKVVMKVCNQESETRYSSVAKNITAGQALKTFNTELTIMKNKIIQSMGILRNAQVDFKKADAMVWETWNLEPESIGLIVTSPPYPNAYDYHLYQRFRIFWLGGDPGDLRRVEIGSHLRHQSKKDGFETYVNEMASALMNMYTALMPGRYAVLVVGNGVYKGVEYETGMELLAIAATVGFEPIGRIERNLPTSRRSVTSAGRRLQQEDLIILRKPSRNCIVSLSSPNYFLTDYEKELQKKELRVLSNSQVVERDNSGDLQVNCSSDKLADLRKLSFSHSFKIADNNDFPTWQGILETKGEENQSSRKEPKYVTHGIHAYKGKFYPQLAKALINISKLKPGAVILDPFMGSGTVLLESYLNGYKGFGIDMNPMAVHIAKAKLGIVKEDPELIFRTVRNVLRRVSEAEGLEYGLSQFPESCHEEIENWFPRAVISKLNFLLTVIRAIKSPSIINFLEVCTSDIIREVSHQDPSDLRIRKRSTLLEDAPVFEMFTKKVEDQLEKLQQYWETKSYCPNRTYPSNLGLGDNRMFDSFENLGLATESVDLIVTSPPYFTALPYIDTDRLSLLTILGIPRQINSKIEKQITGSREISKKEKESIESSISDLTLPRSVLETIYKIQSALLTDSTAGFRRQNVPALLARYFNDMDLVINNLYRLLKKDGLAWIVIGNNKTSIGDKEFIIDSVSLLKDIAMHNGFSLYDEIDITVTRENRKNIKNAITKNGVLCFKKE